MRQRALVAAIWLTSSGMAPAAHVTDKLAVGMYESPEAELPLRLLTSGTPVERLEVRGGYCEVRLGSGEQGWLECRYITDEKPARAMLLEAQASASSLRRELASVREQLAEQTLENDRLSRRLRAAERLLGGDAPALSEIAEEPKPVSNRPDEPRTASGFDSDEAWFWGLAGLITGLLLGGALFFWRCRRRYGGLRF